MTAAQNQLVLNCEKMAVWDWRKRQRSAKRKNGGGDQYCKTSLATAKDAAIAKAKL